jgi:hypothetical protein
LAHEWFFFSWQFSIGALSFRGVTLTIENHVSFPFEPNTVAAFSFFLSFFLFFSYFLAEPLLVLTALSIFRDNA